MVVSVVVAVPVTAVAQSQRFPDVPPDHYAFEAVEWAAGVGVTTGYTDGTFKPQQPLIKQHAVVFTERYYDEILQAEESEDFTRGDMMVLLEAINDGTIRDTESDTAAESPSEQGASQRFPDVPPDHYAFEAVEWAAGVGVTTGYTDGTFKPQQPLIKQHAVVFMERYYDEILQAEESEDFTRGDMMVLLKAINDGTLDGGAPTDEPRGGTSSARDRDGDGLIEVDNLTQLDAIRWDMDGDGISDNADYAAAFYDADTGTMCSVARCAGYELTANLDFDTNGNGEADEGDVYWNSSNGWIPIGENSAFDTTFDGGGHTISNLYIRKSPTVGLFGVLGSGSTVSGIGLVAASIGASGYGAAGALAGTGRGVIEDSFADGLIVGCVDQIGGLVGLNHGSIENSRSAVDVDSAHRTSSRRTCYASGGGLVGENSGTIANSNSTSVVSGFTDNFGGLVGTNSGTITDSYATGTVSGNGFADVGGLVGQNEVEGKITTSYATGGVSGQGDNFGGLAGANSGVIVASYATGTVSGNGFADVGGLVGQNEVEGKITTSYATGGVSGQGDNFGGLAGANSGVIVASYATGTVSGNGFADVGGLVGDNRYTGVVTAVYAEGSVSGRADRYGGLLGSNRGVATVCFSTGEVPQNGGGLIERNGNYGAVTNCYWDKETSNQSDSAGGDDKTTAELQSPTGYTGPYADWNVDLDGDGSSDDPWRFGSTTEYPVLNLGTLDINHGNLNARPPLEPKANATLCSAVNYADIAKVKARIAAGIDVNDTCQSQTAWYDGLTPLAIAKRQGGPAVEAILVEAGAVDNEG